LRYSGTVFSLASPVGHPDAQAPLPARGSVSVVIPAYNESSRLEKTVYSVWRYLDRGDLAFEIIVVDDGSKDDTAAIARRLADQLGRLRLVRLPVNSGKGAAVKTGMLAAAGEFVLFTDADESTSIEQLPLLLRPLREGFDVAMGSRSTRGSAIVRSQGRLRQTLGQVWGLLSKVLVVRGYGDSQCGFKCFRHDAVAAIFPHLTSPTVLFDLEVLLIAGRARMRVAEVPVTWVHDPDTRIPYGLRRAVATFAELLRLRRRWRVWLPVNARAVRIGGGSG
jgi:dolichyl-phosphate beta-glucosyltransferase